MCIPFLHSSVFSATSLRSTVGDRRQAHTSLHERGPTASSRLASISRRQLSGFSCCATLIFVSTSLLSIRFNPIIIVPFNTSRKEYFIQCRQIIAHHCVHVCACVCMQLSCNGSTNEIHALNKQRIHTRLLLRLLLCGGVCCAYMYCYCFV